MATAPTKCCDSIFYVNLITVCCFNLELTVRDIFHCFSQEATLSAEMTAKEGLRIAMEKKERQFKNEIEALEFQV